MVQDLHITNEAAVPIYPMVSNPYTLLAQIPTGTSWFTVLDLKNAFFCILLHPDSQFLFALGDPTNSTTQLTWTVLSQGFQDSPHLFGQTLSWDLTDFSAENYVLLQYVDDLLLCASSEQSIQTSTQTLLNFLGTRGYKVSQPKAQLCETSVKYLGLVLSEETRRLGEDRVHPIASYPLFKTLKQLRGFWA